MKSIIKYKYKLQGDKKNDQKKSFQNLKKKTKRTHR